MPEIDVTKMKVADLKRELKLRGLATTGNKNELQDRLQTALLDGELSLEDTAISGEDLLEDDDAVLTDEEEAKILAADENQLLKSPVATPTTAPELSIPMKSILEDEDEVLGSPPSTATATLPPTRKKLVLKRKSSFSLTTGLTVAKENTEPEKVKMSERNPIVVEGSGVTGKKDEEKPSPAVTKVAELSLKERLELRAKKFGISTNVAAKTTGAAEAVGDGGAVNDEKQIEMLKKRAERFGCVVSSKIAKLDAEEKLQKRKERFGGGAKLTSASATSAGCDAWKEKARLRLERFKTNSSKSAGDIAATTTPASAATITDN